MNYSLGFALPLHLSCLNQCPSEHMSGSEAQRLTRNSASASHYRAEQAKSCRCSLVMAGCHANQWVNSESAISAVKDSCSVQQETDAESQLGSGHT